MAVQEYAETLDFKGDEELLPERHTEAHQDCIAIAANLLSQAINGESINRCWDCLSWAGRCTKGRINLIACSEACGQFSPKLLKR